MLQYCGSKRRPVMTLVVVRQMEGMNLCVLDEVDPNPKNVVASGIIHTGQGQIGCLMRLEPNEDRQVRSHTRCSLVV